MYSMITVANDTCTTLSCFFFNDTATTEIYTTTDTLSLHDALPILPRPAPQRNAHSTAGQRDDPARSEEHTSELQSPVVNSYAVFCLKKKNTRYILERLTSLGGGVTDADELAFSASCGCTVNMHPRTYAYGFFFFNDTATTEIYTTTDTLSLHDALPI